MLAYLCKQKKTLENLALAGGFDSFDKTHRAQYFNPDGDGIIFLERVIRFGAKYQDNLNSSQTSLFGDQSEGIYQELIIPNAPKWQNLEQLKREKEVVGIYLSGHPLDDFKKEMHWFTNGKLAHLKDLSLWDKKDQRLRQLSGGMKRRVLIAKALSHEPNILFLDEPTAGVDVELRQEMWKVVESLRDTGVTIILTTHYIEEAEAIADRIGVINQGEIIVIEKTEELLKKMGHKKLTVELQEKIDNLPPTLDKYNLTLGKNNMSVDYTYSVREKQTGITNLLQDLKDSGLKLRDLKCCVLALYNRDYYLFL